MPVAVGFGIGTAEQAAAVGAVADGVIVGSRLVRAVAEAGERTGAQIAVADFIAGARAAMSRHGLRISRLNNAGPSSSPYGLRLG